MTRGPRNPFHAPARAAFTLIELLVVIGIIALVIGILIPTLAAVRDAARKTATTALANDVITASTSYITDTRRPPGYFPQSAMGTITNAEEGGFTNTENVLLDLAGGIVPISGANAPDDSNTFVDVGPRNGSGVGGTGPLDPGSGSNPEIELVRVDNALVGSNQAGGGYLSLKDDVLLPITGQNNNNPMAPDRTDMVDLVDFFGQPLMIWTPDETAVLPTTEEPTYGFALRNSTLDQNAPLNERARYYWGSAAGYLASPSLGTRGIDQNNQSILGASSEDDDLTNSLQGILGSPAYPVSDPNDPFRSIPLRARGKVVVISAGPDQTYFARRQDPGAAIPTSTNEIGKIVDYAPRNEVGAPGDPRNNEVGAFDDIVLGGGE